MEREYYLQKILEHTKFRKSKRQRELLLYLFQNSISEDRKDIKELTLAIDIYGEAPCFDPASKCYVRVAVYKLRKKLEEYYDHDGRYDRIRLSIPRGNYCVLFSYGRGTPDREPESASGNPRSCDRPPGHGAPWN